MKHLTTTLLLLSCIGRAVAGNPELVLNGGFESGNTGFSSQYGYCSTSGCLSAADGESKYAIGSDPSFFHGGFSGSMTGAFMVVNGALSPLKLWSQTITVEPATIYTFSFESRTIWPGSVPNFEVYINGSKKLTQSGPSFGSAPQLFSFDFNTESSSSITIDIIDINTDFVGNDFGIDNISLIKTTSQSISISGFSAVSRNNKVWLEWESAPTGHIRTFVVERSKSADREFAETGRLVSDEIQRLKFSFEDQKPLEGTSYYRLRCIDVDDIRSFSDIRMVSRQHPADKSKAFTAIISGDICHVQLNESWSKATLFLSGPQGRFFVKVNGSGTTRSIDLSALQSGWFLIKAILPDGNSYVQKLILMK